MAPLDPYADTADDAGGTGYDTISANDPSGGGATVRTPTPKPTGATATAASSDGWTDVPNSVKPAQATLTTADLAKEPNPIVRMLVQGDYDPALMRRFKPEEQQTLLQRAQQYDPGLDLSNYPAKAQAKKAFTSGKSADAIRSINQFLGHVNQLADSESTLNNSNILPGVTNTVGNTVAGWFSGDAQHRQAQYDAVAQAVANEYENMIRGSSISGVKEREANLSDLGKNRSPEAVRGWIDGALGVMNSRLNELQNQYKQGTGLQYGFDVLNPKSKSILKRFGVTPEDSSAGAGTAPSGAPTTATPATVAPKPARVPVNDPRIDKFMQDNGITDRGQAIRILQQNGVM